MGDAKNKLDGSERYCRMRPSLLSETFFKNQTADRCGHLKKCAALEGASLKVRSRKD